jgi:hypothetical protein
MIGRLCAFCSLCFGEGIRSAMERGEVPSLQWVESIIRGIVGNALRRPVSGRRQLQASTHCSPPDEESLPKASGYTDRGDYAETGEQCDLSDRCQLHADHGGDCDVRTERERWEDLYQELDDRDAAPKSCAQGLRARRAS